MQERTDISQKRESIASNQDEYRTSTGCTVGRMTKKSTRRVLGHSLLCSLIRPHRSLIRLLRTARALRCAHSFSRSLTHSGARGKEVFVDFKSFQPTVQCVVAGLEKLEILNYDSVFSFKDQSINVGLLQQS